MRFPVLTLMCCSLLSLTRAGLGHTIPHTNSILCVGAGSLALDGID